MTMNDKRCNFTHSNVSLSSPLRVSFKTTVFLFYFTYKMYVDLLAVHLSHYENHGPGFTKSGNLN